MRVGPNPIWLMSLQDGFPGGSDKESSCRRRHKRHGFTPGWRRSPGEGNGNPLQNSCLGNPMNRRAWQATVQGLSKTRPWLSTPQLQDEEICTHGVIQEMHKTEKAIWASNKKAAIRQVKREASEESRPDNTLILDFQPPEMWKNTFLLCKAPSLWNFVNIALEILYIYTYISI